MERLKGPKKLKLEDFEIKKTLGTGSFLIDFNKNPRFIRKS